MEIKHTPGPWSVNGGDDVWIGNRICIYVGDENDARLIAAAPDLLEALKVMVEYYGYTSYPSAEEKELDDDVIEARAAIAKATGEYK